MNYWGLHEIVICLGSGVLIVVGIIWAAWVIINEFGRK